MNVLIGAVASDLVRNLPDIPAMEGMDVTEVASAGGANRRIDRSPLEAAPLDSSRGPAD